MTEFWFDENYPPIVLDNGSFNIKAGFAGDDGPLTVFRNLIGNSKDDSFIGDNAQEKRDLLSLHKPIEHGIIVDWESMEKVWNFTFSSEMHVLPEKHPMLVAERPLNPRGNRETMAQVMFEGYNTPAFYIAFEPVLALYSGGKVCGTMVDVGDGVTHVVPVSEGMAPKHAMKRIDFAGNDLTTRLQALLHKKGFTFTTTAEVDMVREMKEKCCYLKEEPVTVSESTRFNNNNSYKDDTIQRYKLPDGLSIDLSSERYMCPEILFQSDGLALGRHIVDSINSCENVTRKDLFSSIILSGGTTFLPGFLERLQNELGSLVPNDVVAESVRIRAYPERRYLVWIGGSILASLTTFNPMWITKSEYNEFGPNIVHRKCF